ncbi:transmembrane protein 223-like [Tubulanus polymorphus]|uniref:transmembrane protein 223-like n=1 Tax=Tubulanus polymorphus TaxID=672921 RepID=UPI003DA1CE95
MSGNLLLHCSVNLIRRNQVFTKIGSTQINSFGSAVVHSPPPQCIQRGQLFLSKLETVFVAKDVSRNSFHTINNQKFSSKTIAGITNRLMFISGSIPRKMNFGFFSPINNGKSIYATIGSATKRRMTGKAPFEIDPNVSQDVLLFRYDNERLYKVLGLFGIAQFIFWMYLAHFSYNNLIDVNSTPSLETSSADQDSLPWWKKINLGKNMYRNGITGLCLSLGYICLAISIIYPLRTIHRLYLLKGGKSVMIETYSFAARKRTMTVPLEHVTCLHSRIGKENQIAMKIKDRYMFFLIDKSGTFTNTKLYDYAVGIKRVW